MHLPCLPKTRIDLLGLDEGSNRTTPEQDVKIRRISRNKEPLLQMERLVLKLTM